MICHLCNNKEHQFMPYKITNDMFEKIQCYFCKQYIKLCPECYKYTNFGCNPKLRMKYTNLECNSILRMKYIIHNTSIPDQYYILIKEFEHFYPQCIDCFITGERNKYKSCYGCSKHIHEKNFTFCTNCCIDCCIECNINTCTICNTLLNIKNNNNN